MFSPVKQAAAFSLSQSSAADPGVCPFRLAVINDEITQDFERACQIVSADFGLHWIELRSMWDKNVTELGAKQIEDAKKLLGEYKLRVTDIASPLFKVDWPGAPKSQYGSKKDMHGADEVAYIVGHAEVVGFVVEDKLLPVAAAAIERAGFKVDVPALAALSRAMETELESLSRRIYELAGGEFNVHSPIQLAEAVAYTHLTLPTLTAVSILVVGVSCI